MNVAWPQSLCSHLYQGNEAGESALKWWSVYVKRQKAMCVRGCCIESEMGDSLQALPFTDSLTLSGVPAGLCLRLGLLTGKMGRVKPTFPCGCQKQTIVMHERAFYRLVCRERTCIICHICDIKRYSNGLERAHLTPWKQRKSKGWKENAFGHHRR